MTNKNGLHHGRFRPFAGRGAPAQGHWPKSTAKDLFVEGDDPFRKKRPPPKRRAVKKEGGPEPKKVKSAKKRPIELKSASDTLAGLDYHDMVRGMASLPPTDTDATMANHY